MITPEAFRARFPIFERKVFLNSCSKGALSDAVREAYGDYLESWGTEGSPWDDWVELLEKTRSSVARFIGAHDDEVAIGYSTSTLVASVLSAMSFDGERSRIAIGDFEFPTMAHNLITQEKRGASIVRVRAQDGELPVGAYVDALDERVRIVPAAHVCFRNGYQQDVSALTRAAKDVGAYVLVDDYQSTGTKSVDVHALGCDFWVTGTLKYLLGSSGLGFLYVRRDLIAELEPVMTGWFGQARPFDFDIERATYHESARRFETGTPPTPNLYAGLAGLALLDEVGPSAIEQHIASLTAAFIARAKERGFDVLTPEEPERRGPLVVVNCKDAESVVAGLAEKDFVASSRGTGLRVSFHYYNLFEDIDRLIDAMDALSEHISRR